MSPLRKASSAATPPKPRQPMKAFSLGVTTLGSGSVSNTSFSPQDSLAESDGKSTGYFLQFTPDKTPPPVKPKPSHKSVKSPVKGRLPFTPAKTTPSLTSRSRSTKQQPNKSLPSRQTPKKSPTASTRRAPLKSLQSEGTKSRGRTGRRSPRDGFRTRSVSPKIIRSGFRTRSVSPKVSGFRTRSISPKVLKKDNQSKGLGEQDMLSVVDKCNKLLKTLSQDRQHSLSRLRHPVISTASKMQMSVNNCDSETATCIDQPDSQHTLINEITDKRTNTDTNNTHSDKTHSSIERIKAATFIDSNEDNCMNNEDITCETNAQNVNIVTLPSTNSAISSTGEVDVDVCVALDSNNTPTFDCTESVTENCSDYSLTFHPVTSCQEEEGNEAERDLHLGLDDDKVDGEQSVTYAQLKNQEIDNGEREQDCLPLVNPPKPTEQVEPYTGFLKQEPPSGGTQTSNMASSWMDRLKEDLDNDDEWLSEEEEFQREQEAQLRAAAHRAALAQAESSSEDELPSRPTPQPRRTESSKLKHDSSSSDEGHTGFQHNQRNFASRKSINRSSYSAEDYSSDEELAMSRGAHGGGGAVEPNHDEMDLMVKRNLAYVNPNDLDKMDILTSDLDVPQDQLRLESGVGEMLRGHENMVPADRYSEHDADGQIDIREGSQFEDHIEVSGSLHVVESGEGAAAATDVTKWDIQGYTDHQRRDSHSTSESDSQTDQKEKSREEFITALVDDLRQSDREMADRPASYADVNTGYAQEELVLPNSNQQELVSGYSTEVLRPSRNRDWRKQLSQKMTEWEDELPSPHSDRLEAKDEAVTSFMSEEDDEEGGLDGHPVSPPSLDRSRSTEEELREKVEDSLHNKIRDWKNMTAESVTGQVDEWQSLGNFNIPSAKRRSHDLATGDADAPAEKKRELFVAREDSGEYADINRLQRQASSYDDDDIEERDAAADDSDGERERGVAADDEADGYASDSSSQDTVRERITPRRSKGSLSDTDSAENIASNPSSSTASREGGIASEPGYVEILGGEEPPDEWLNLGTRRERIDSSSSSSDGSGFQYISAEKSPSYLQNTGRVHENDFEQEAVSVPHEHQRGRLSTPPLDLPSRSHVSEAMTEELIIQSQFERQEHCPSPVDSLDNEPTYDAVAPSTSVDITIPHDQMEETPALRDVKSDEDNVVEVVGEQRPALSSPEPEEVEEPPALTRLAEAPSRGALESSSDSSDSEVDVEAPHETPALQSEATADPPAPSPRSDSYDRVEKLREEMRSSARSKSADIPNVRQSRSTERFTERMKSLEQTKAMREKRTPTPTGLTGKFSAAFSRFEPTDNVRLKKQSSLTNKSRDDASPSYSTGSPHTSNQPSGVDKQTEKDKPRLVKQDPAVDVEVIKPAVEKTVQSVPQQSPPTSVEPKRRASLSKAESVDEKTTDSKPKRVERSKTFNTAIPNRASGAKVLEKMAKFGQSMDVPKTTQAVTTKNKDTERFERRTHSTDSHSTHSSQPHFDVDIQISREPLPSQEQCDSYGYPGNTTAAITVGRDQVKVARVDSQQRAGQESRKEEYINVWDTEVPVTDGKKKVLMPRRLHVTSVSKEIKPSTSRQSKSAAVNRSRSEPRVRRASSTQSQEVSVTVRPQFSTNQHSEAPGKQPVSTSDRQEQARMRSSIALQPKDEVIPTTVQQSQSARQYGSPSKSVSQSQRSSSKHSEGGTSNERRGHPQEPERDHPLQKADSLDELRSGQLVAQTKNMFSNEDPNADRILPTSYAKVYSSAKPESFVRGSSERSWDNRRKERQDMISDAVRDLVGVYDQAETDSRHDYNVGYSRESLEYTRKWVENTDVSPEIPPHPTAEDTQYLESADREKMADPVKDDAAFRRIQAANRNFIPKHFTTPSYLTLSSASPEPSIISDRGRARSTDRNNKDRPVGRPKGRSRSLPRRKPSKAIADRASVFSTEAPTDISYTEDIKPASTRPLHSQSFSRRSTSPRTVTQKERLAARRSMPASAHKDREGETEQGSPRAASKGVAMMVELYNKNKSGDSVLADVDEQTLASVDDNMFSQRGAQPTSPPAVDETPLSSQAWKAWLGKTDRSALEQKVEKAYNKRANSQPAAPPVKRDSKPVVNSGWQQRTVQEEPAIRPTHTTQSYSSAPLASPPRPAKSDQAVEAQQRRAWSHSPPAPTLPQRGYSVEPQYPQPTHPNHASAFDNYKQQSLTRFRQEEQYATVQRPPRAEPHRQQPPQPSHSRPNSFDQALLLQAAPPKPERLYNTSELWDAYPPTDYPTTNSLHGYNQPKPTHYPTDPRANPRADYRVDPRTQRLPSADYPDPRQQQQHRDQYYRDYPSSNKQHKPAQQRYDEQGYPQQQTSYRSHDHGYKQPVKPNYGTQRESGGYDSRVYQGDQYNAYPTDHVDSYRYNTNRKEPRYPHEQPPRGPIPDPRYPQTNGVRSPPPQQTDPRYGAFDPRLETGGRPRRTNSVPNIKQHITSPKPVAQNTAYNPRYHDQYMAQQQYQHQRTSSGSGSGSLPRNSKKDKNRSKDNRNSAGLPEFIPIQYATGKYATRPTSQQPPQNYNYPQKQFHNNNYPSTVNNNSYNGHPNDHAYPTNGHHYPSNGRLYSSSGPQYSSNGHGYPANGHAYPTNGHVYPSNGHAYPTNGHAYSQDDQYIPQRSRPGVGVIYNPDLGISDF